jgi:Zinc finger, C2H2 type
MAEECPDCQASFASAADLMVHRREAHPEGRASTSLGTNPAIESPWFACTLCGARFRTAAGLASHNLRPHGPVPEPADTPTS